jgi:hypothetical protein
MPFFHFKILSKDLKLSLSCIEIGFFTNICFICPFEVYAFENLFLKASEMIMSTVLTMKLYGQIRRTVHRGRG